MNKETIEKAARKYAFENAWYPGETSYESDIREMEQSFSDAFISGAQWRVNSVWHDARKEVPEKCKLILTERKGRIFSLKASVNMESCPLSWVRWAYIDDLLPERKEGGR